MPKIIKLSENPYYKGFEYAVSCGRPTSFQRSLDELTKKQLTLDVFLLSEANILNTPISLAAQLNNENAVRVLCNKLKSLGILDLSQEVQGGTALHVAACIGNADIIKTLLHYGSDANAYSDKQHSDGETPLMFATRMLPTYSLIEEGEWFTSNDTNNANEKMRAELQQWYQQEKAPAPEGNLTVHWSGSLKVLKELLERGKADVHATNKYNFSPLTLVNALTNPNHSERQIFEDGHGTTPKIINVNMDQITFEATIANRTNTVKKTVRVVYDVRECRKLFEQYSNQNKNTSLDSKQLREIKEEMAERSKKLDELEKDVKRQKEELKPVVEDNKKKEERDKLVASFSGGQAVFYRIFSTKLYAQSNIVSILSLSRGWVDRGGYAKADKAAKGVSAVLGKVPVAGNIVGGIVSTGIQAVSDHYEHRDHNKQVSNQPVPKEWFHVVDDIAVALITEPRLKDLKKLNDKNAAAIIDECVLSIYRVFIKEMKGDIVKIAVEAVLDPKNKLLSIIDKHLVTQDKENAKQQAQLAKKTKAEEEKKKADDAKVRAIMAEQARKQQYNAATLTQFSNVKHATPSVTSTAKVSPAVANAKPLAARA